MANSVDPQALASAAARFEWAPVLPRDEDTAEERAARRQALLRVTKVTQHRLQAVTRAARGQQAVPAAANAQQQQQQQRSGSKRPAEADAASTIAGKRHAASPAGGACQQPERVQDARQAAAAGAQSGGAQPSSTHQGQQEQPASGAGAAPPAAQAAGRDGFRSRRRGRPAESEAAQPAAASPAQWPVQAARAQHAAIEAAAAAEAEAVWEEDKEGREEFRTPLMARMLPGPGPRHLASNGRGTGPRSARAGSGDGGSTGPSSSGIPSASTAGPGSVPSLLAAAGEAERAQAAGRRRRQRGTCEPAAGSGRLPLSTAGFLSRQGPGEASAAPASGVQQQQQPQAGSAAPNSGTLQQQQQPDPRSRRRWVQQQQDQQSNPVALQLLQRKAAAASQQQQHQQPPLSQQTLLDGSTLLQPTRLSRFAAGAAAGVPAAGNGLLPGASPFFAAPASLSTQIAPSQLLECGTAMDPRQQREAEQRLLGPTAEQPADWRQELQLQEPTVAAAQPRLASAHEQGGRAAQPMAQQEGRHGQRAQQAQQREREQAQQQPPAWQQQQQQHGRAGRQRQDGAAPAEAAVHQPQQAGAGAGAGPTPGRPPRGPAPAPAAPAVSTATAAGKHTAAAGKHTAGTAATGALAGATEWTLPPTPSCIYDLSPDSPATALTAGRPAGAAAAGAAAGMQPTSSVAKPARARDGAVAGNLAGDAAPASVLRAPGSEQRPSIAAPAAAAGGGSTAGKPGLALRRLPDFSCAAETPAMLVGSRSSLDGEQGQLLGTGSEARQLFVAETPSDAAAAGGRGTSSAEEAQPGALPAAAGGAAPAAAAAAGNATPAGFAATTPEPGSWSRQAAGLQLQLPEPVLQAVPCADGRHVALLLGSYAPAGEPQHVLVLRLPGEAQQGPQQGPQQQGPQQAQHGGVQVLASLAVERSKWGQDLVLSPNCLQLASTDKAGLQLVLSAALQLSDQPPPAAASILVISLSALAASGAGDGRGSGGEGGRRRRRLPGLLAIEHKYGLTCVALAGGNSLYATGEFPSVLRLDLDPLWTSYTWSKAELPAAWYKSQFLQDISQLVPYQDPERPSRRLLLGLSSSGAMALWDADRCQLLATRSHYVYGLLSLHPVSMQQAGLSTPVKKRVTAAEAAAAATEPLERASDGPHLFVGLVEDRRTRKRHVAAVMLSAGNLLVSASGAVVQAAAEWEPGQPAAAAAAARKQQQQQLREVTAIAAAPGARCCWLGTAGGEVFAWDVLTGRAMPAAPGTAGSAAAAAGGQAANGVVACHSRRAVASLCAFSGGGEWGLVAGTSGGSCTLLARA